VSYPELSLLPSASQRCGKSVDRLIDPIDSSVSAYRLYSTTPGGGRQINSPGRQRKAMATIFFHDMSFSMWYTCEKTFLLSGVPGDFRFDLGRQGDARIP
jgi:hypothetical protein